MSEMSKEALAAACEEKVKQLEFSVQQSAFDSIRHELETELAIARVALLALRERAEPVAATAEITALERERDELLAALEDIIAYNVQYATDKYGDASKAETMACVRRSREAIARAATLTSQGKDG
ncbi:hypothetical protein [Cronobacter sakazakii]|uniref:hypothetical protein n=1 Tax=Cronobacter sakazakii TaxID=28141 RepID=UPI002894A9A9|nr:hypothetical protein [Cronobacter sakazakii]MDT3546596.1 hypothetical protein [Cronobacter sakazakii]